MSEASINKAVRFESEALIQPFVPALSGARPENASVFDDLQALYRIIVNQKQFTSVSEAISAALYRVCQRFSLKRGLVLKAMSNQVFEIKAAFDPQGDLFVGQHLMLSPSDLLLKHQEYKIIVEPNLNDLAVKTPQLNYNLQGTVAYAGISTTVEGISSGVVCFLSDEHTDCSFGQEDMLVLELVAEGIACMTELQAARAARKTEDLAVMASGSMKSLEEYQAQAKLPEGLGISGKVVDVLQKRIGQSSLSIDNIAGELNLSKRTLQRRLQQQGISFAELRDKVRFHYSIDLLVKQQISIDRISSTLDFSDRTSFTNAFKRWTGLSPSTFRKVFRDYV